MARPKKKKFDPKATSWDQISGMDTGDSIANRNVYEEQQLERSRIEKKQTPTTRNIAAAIMALLTFLAAWAVLSMLTWVGASVMSGLDLGSDPSSSSVRTMDEGGRRSSSDADLSATSGDRYFRPMYERDGAGGMQLCFQPMSGPNSVDVTADCYERVEDIPVPSWYEGREWTTEDAARMGGSWIGASASADGLGSDGSGSDRGSSRSSSGGDADGTWSAGEGSSSSSGLGTDEGNSYMDRLLEFSWWKFLLSLLASLLVWSILHRWLMRNLDSQNLLNDTSDINQHFNDQHIAPPEEVLGTYDVFPDVGAHSIVQPSSMLSHAMLEAKGLKSVQVSRRAEDDVLDEDGDVELHAGDIVRDEDGEALTETKPIIDTEFGEALFDASGMPKDKVLRRRFDARKIPYNPDGSNRDKAGKYKTVADLINDDWEFPEYEVQRPAGIYVVDTAPVNTMILAMTRAGKGQTYIEPVIDMWTREKRQNNIVVNDPKGELLVKNYVRATLRGYQVVQFNLINSMKTDIYNPLGMAADAAREGDTSKCAEYVNNIADVFFPLDGGEDPMWPSAANNAFKRAAYGLIDYYLEEEREIRFNAMVTNKPAQVLDTELDALWGKVTLYNCYQFFVQLTSKKMKNPLNELDERVKAGEFPETPEGESALETAKMIAEKRAFLWDDNPDIDMFTLYFNASAHLPKNSMRTLISNADNALRAMAGAERMLASVYGIAITAMSFFTDPTISTLTSGTPSQNTDLGGISFPRRLGVRFAENYIKENHLLGAQVKWDAFEDAGFTTSLGKMFAHDDTVTRNGWAQYYFEGIFPERRAYLRLRLLSSKNGMLLKQFHFKFTKGYQTTLNGRQYVLDPVMGERIIRGGTLLELVQGEDGAFVPGHTTFKQTRLTNLTTGVEKEGYDSQVISQNMVRYSEKPKIIFLVTPPHLMSYAKLILILIKQLVDLNFDKSYMTKSSQKPLYKTRFMLDELGNLQSEGHGISGFETMLSIGLGQEQQFTLILQTLQQLKDVYGDSVDKIVQGNTSDIIFLKSTDDTMIETLVKMSGTRHVAYRESKTVTKDMEKMFMQTEGKVSYTVAVKEEPVISYNDLAFLTERNSIVFRAGDSPIWNRNEMILPMSWRLFKDTIQHPGHEYTLQTIPTLSSAMDFDVRQNQPDFVKMLSKRLAQAERVTEAVGIHKDAYGFDEYAISLLDPDVYSDEIMQLVTSVMIEETGADPYDDDELDMADLGEKFLVTEDGYEVNTEQEQINAELMAAEQVRTQRVFAGGQISREMLVNRDGRGLAGNMRQQIVDSYHEAKTYMAKDRELFRVDDDGSLYGADGQPYITREGGRELEQLLEASKDPGARVYAEDGTDEQVLGELGTFTVHAAFYEFLAARTTWTDFAQGRFEQAMAKRVDPED